MQLHSELQRPQLKIKQSLTRDFSIENLIRAAGRTKLQLIKKHVRTPTEVFNTMDNQSDMMLAKGISRTPNMQSALARGGITSTERRKADDSLLR